MLLIYHFTARMSMKIYKIICTIIHFLFLFMHFEIPLAYSIVNSLEYATTVIVSTCTSFSIRYLG